MLCKKEHDTPEIFLHAGFPKTGSTAMQAFLFANKEALVSQGVLYPEASLDEYTAHHKFAAGLGISDTDWVGGRSDPKDTAFQVLAEARQRNCDRILLSSEEFSRLDCARDFTSLFPNCRVHIISFIRPQAEWLFSRLKHEILNLKNRRVTWDISEFDIKSCSYLSMYTRWRCHVSSNCLHFLPYQKSKTGDLANGKALAKAVGFSLDALDAQKIDEYTSQPSLPFEAVEAVRILNNLKIDDASARKARKVFFKVFNGFVGSQTERLRCPYFDEPWVVKRFSQENMDFSRLLGVPYDELFFDTWQLSSNLSDWQVDALNSDKLNLMLASLCMFDTQPKQKNSESKK